MKSTLTAMSEQEYKIVSNLTNNYINAYYNNQSRLNLSYINVLSRETPSYAI